MKSPVSFKVEVQTSKTSSEMKEAKHKDHVL